MLTKYTDYIPTIRDNCSELMVPTIIIAPGNNAKLGPTKPLRNVTDVENYNLAMGLSIVS